MKECYGYRRMTPSEIIEQERAEWRDLREPDHRIENAFTYHSPKDGQPEQYVRIREMGKDLAYLIKELVPDSREKSLAMTKLEEAVMWANAGIARN